MLEVFVFEFKQNKQLSKSFYLLYSFQFNKQITQTINIMAKVWPIYQGEWKGHKGECFFPPTSPTGRVSKKKFLHPC